MESSEFEGKKYYLTDKVTERDPVILISELEHACRLLPNPDSTPTQTYHVVLDSLPPVDGSIRVIVVTKRKMLSQGAVGNAWTFRGIAVGIVGKWRY